MSSNYSANQYDNAFRSQRLQNWCETERSKERPTAQRGHTSFIVDDRGHLLPGLIKRGSAWSDFKGTWDLPVRIPAHRINPTSRSVEGLNRLKSWGFDPQHTGKSQPHGVIKNTNRLQDNGEQTTGDVQKDSAEARPESQTLPVTVAAPTVSQNKDLQPAVVACIDQPVEEKQGATGKEGPLSQGSAAEEKPALRPAARG